MTPDHEDHCAALTGLPDVCTCGALFRLAVSAASREEQWVSEHHVLDEAAGPRQAVFHLLELFGWAWP